MKILVVSMTTWGEMGNWLSGKSLAAALEAVVPNAHVRILAAEPLVPAFAETGLAIKRATLESKTTAERFARYSAVLHGLEELLPPGFEEKPSGNFAATLAATIADDPPDVLVGTKGVICRALLAALRMAGLERPVINYVTNHAHFQFPVHRCEGASLHLVRFPEGKAYLETHCGFPSTSILPVGYLIAARQLGDVLPKESSRADDARRSLIVVSNRGNEEYVELLRQLVPMGPDIHVHFIGINDEALCSMARQLIDTHGLDHWRAVSELGQAEFFRLLLEARAQGVCALACKASPNSIFEGIYFGLPLFLVRTGLPMEEWGAEVVVRERLGVVEEDVSALAPHLVSAFGGAPLFQDMIARQRVFREAHLNQEECARQLRRAIERVMAASSASPDVHT